MATSPTECSVTPAPADGARAAPGAGEGVPGPPLPSVFRAAEQSAEFQDHLRAHYRETRRVAAEIGAEIRLLLNDGRLYDQGTAVIRNISPSGALLGDVHLPRDSFPAAAFRVELRLRGEPYEGIGIHARPVRFEPGLRGLGVQFEEIFVAA
jgi:hypothetical protein